MLTNPNTQLASPLDAIIFDCDGTLSAIEGIDELARQNKVGPEVELMTAEAMGKSGINPALYKARLDLIRPTAAQVHELGDIYYDCSVPECEITLQLLQQLNKKIYIVSAGLKPSVSHFAARLNIPAENVFAVDIFFDNKGDYCDYDHLSPLTQTQGKREIVTAIKERHPRLGYIGDGMNDLAVKDIVTRFIGYGGIFYRENIAALCEFYVETPPLTAILQLLLTEDEMLALENLL